MRCPVCESTVKPIAKRPSALPRSLAFNQVIGVDLVELDDLGIQMTLLNVVCWGTGYQMMSVIPDKRSATVRDAFSKDWIRHYGWPELVVTDQGPEFIGHEFVDYVAEGACLQQFIDSKSPWQQGRTERSGDAIKDMLKKVATECGIVTQNELEIALTHALDSRNRYCNRSG